MPTTQQIRHRNTLRHENDYLRAETDRLYTLLADALQCAADGQPFGPLELMEALAARRGFNLGRAHLYDKRPADRQAA